jgi:hypothetical protein
MGISVTCRQCGRRYAVPAALGGRRGRWLAGPGRVAPRALLTGLLSAGALGLASRGGVQFLSQAAPGCLSWLSWLPWGWFCPLLVTGMTVAV